MRRFVFPTFLVITLLAGCISPDQPQAPAGTRTPNTGGDMTGSEKRMDDATVCADGGSLSKSQTFCATRTITVAGTISGITKMDVDVGSFNGDVTFHTAGAGKWGFVATLHATGSTLDEAKKNLDNIQFSWSHVEGASHFLQAHAKKDGEGSGYSATFDVGLPPSITYVLVGTTTNGDVTLTDLATDGLSLRTTNGHVSVSADVTQVQLSATNGDVAGKLRVTGPGRLTGSSTNGNVRLEVPEDAQHGYDATLTTTNGQVNVQMSDGQKGDCPTGSQYYTPPCTHRTFRSTNYDARAIRSLVTVTTTNGDVTLMAT
ncbi:MAG: DUF4097 family beta strand repeat-containing protein [Candidatus Thermoplasmatota archaeon]